MSEYLKTQDSILSELIQLEETIREPIATSLWQYNRSQLNALVSGLARMPIIEGIDVSDMNGKKILSERSYASDSAPLSVFDITSDLYWILNGEQVFLGSIIPICKR